MCLFEHKPICNCELGLRNPTLVLSAARRSSLTNPTCQLSASPTPFPVQYIHYTYRIRTCIQLVQKPLIPRIHTILEDALDNAQQPLFPARISNLQLFSQQALQLLRGMELHKRCPGARALNAQATAQVLGLCILVCCVYKRNDKVCDGCEQLSKQLARSSFDRGQ